MLNNSWSNIFWRRSFSVMLVVFIGTVSVAHAGFSAQELEVFDNEPPVIKDLLMRANVLESSDDDLDADWKAATLYCEASRYCIVRHHALEAQKRFTV